MKQRLCYFTQDSTRFPDHTMDADREASRLNAKPSATYAIPNKPPLSIKKAESRSPKLDSKLNEPHLIQRIDRPDAESSAPEAGFITQQILGASEKGGLDGTGMRSRT